MKIAVFGGSGFLGYSFVRHALQAGDVTPIVYSSSPKSLANVARHEIDIRLYPSSQPEAAQLDPDVSLIINYSHPFEARDKIGGRSEEHTSELQSLMRISYAVFCLKKK